MKNRSTAHNPWARPDDTSSGSGAPVLPATEDGADGSPSDTAPLIWSHSDARSATPVDGQADDASSSATTRRSWFWPLVAALGLVVGGVGFAAGRSAGTESNAASPTTTPTPATLGGVTPPAPGGTKTNSDSTSTATAVTIDKRLVGPTRMVAIDDSGLVEVDFATGRQGSLGAHEAGIAKWPMMVVGDDWEVFAVGVRVVAHRDDHPDQLVSLSNLYAGDPIWPAGANQVWTSNGSPNTLTTTWQRLDLAGNNTALVQVPAQAELVGATENGLIGGYRGSTFEFGPLKATKLSDGVPLAVRDNFVVLYACTTPDNCALSLVDADTHTSTTARNPLESPARIVHAALSPDHTRLAVLTAADPASSDSENPDAAGDSLRLVIVDLAVGGIIAETNLRLSVASEYFSENEGEKAELLSWSPDGRFVITMAPGWYLATDAQTGTQIALGKDIAKLTGARVRP